MYWPAPPDKDDGPRAFLSNIMDSRTIEDILEAILRAAQASQELGNYYVVLKEHLEHMESYFDTLQPLPDEIEVCKLWNKHHKRSQRLVEDFRDVMLHM